MDIIETHELLQVLENNPPKSNYWRNLAFGRAVYFDTEYIDFDIIDKGRRLAPFVAPHVQGQPMLARKQSIRRFKPAYIKPKDAVDLNRVMVRRAGERIGGSLTPAERYDAVVAEILFDHDDMIDRRLEWMAAEAVIKGAVTITGENYPTVTVDFGRAAGNFVTLAGTARWGQADDTVITNIRDWTKAISKSGSIATRLTLGQNAASEFFNDEEIKDLLDTRRGSTLTLETGRFQGGAVATLHGVLPGGIEVWTYADVWEDNDGFEQPFLDPNEIVLTGDVQGVECYGAIMDEEAGWQAMKTFPKMWRQPDPSGTFIMTQSAPLLVPLRPNASFRAKVMG